jgi:hypothetical protein
MNYEGKPFSVGGAVVDPQVEKNKQAIDQLGQVCFVGAFPISFDLPSSAQMWISGIPGPFYSGGYSPGTKDFVVHTHASSEFSTLSSVTGSPYGVGWNRPASAVGTTAAFNITVRASFFSLPSIQVYMGLNIARLNNGSVVSGEAQYKVRTFDPSTPADVVYQYVLDIVVQVDLTNCDELQFYTWGGLSIPQDPPTFHAVRFTSGTTDENQIKVIRLR